MKTRKKKDKPKVSGAGDAREDTDKPTRCFGLRR